MQHFRWPSVWMMLLLMAASCGKPLPVLDNIDLKKWKDDPNACREERTGMVNALREQKSKLLGLSEMDIIKLLGKPDQNELYTRNQKFYHYYIEPGPACKKGA